jgi:hypothetical protein
VIEPREAEPTAEDQAAAGHAAGSASSRPGPAVCHGPSDIDPALIPTRPVSFGSDQVLLSPHGPQQQGAPSERPLLLRTSPLRRRRGSTQVGPELMNDRIAPGVTKCLRVFLRPQLVDSGGQLMDVGCQLVQVGAQGSHRGGIDHGRADIPAQRNPRVRQSGVPARSRHVHPRGRWLRVPTGRHLYSLPQSPGLNLNPRPLAAGGVGASHRGCDRRELFLRLAGRHGTESRRGRRVGVACVGSGGRSSTGRLA